MPGALTTVTHSHQIIPFKASHIRELEWPEAELLKLAGDASLYQYEANLGFSGFCDGQFVAAGGIVKIYKGLGEGWAIAGPLMHSHRLWFHGTFKRCIVSFEETLELHRHQIMVRESFEASHKWVQSLGFVYECTHRKYGIKGEDMRVYVRFPEC